MVDDDGNTITDRKSIADVFADFYAQLDREDDSQEPAGREDNVKSPIPECFFHSSECSRSRSWSVGNVMTKRGVIAEVIKHGGKNRNERLSRTVGSCLAAKS